MLATGAALIIAIVWLVVWFLAFDDGGIRRGDLAYFVFIPAKVRGLPAFAQCDEPVYATSTKDYLEAETIKMEFPSHFEGHALVAAYEREVSSWTCARDYPSGPDSSVTFRCEDPKVAFRLMIADPPNERGCRRITLEFRFSPAGL
jgi:hypothetical protein